jgi:hypothetical protein
MDGYNVSENGDIRAWRKLEGGMELTFFRWNHKGDKRLGNYHQALILSLGKDGVLLREDRRVGNNRDLVFGHVNGVYNTDLYVDEFKGLCVDRIRYEIDNDTFILYLSVDKVKEILKKNKIKYAVVIDPFERK